MSIETATAKSIIDCRVVTGGITECNPYGAKFLRAKEISYDLDRQKLIREKTLPVPEKKDFVKVISVADMIEKYVDVEESVRFKGSDKTSTGITIVKEPISLEIPEKEIEVPEQIKPEKPKITYGKYIVVKGDALSKIAKRFGLKTKTLSKLNGLKTKSRLRIGQKLKLPFEQKMIDALSSAKYIIEEGDTLISIAKKFKLEPKALMKFNGIKRNATIRTGKIIKLPLPYILAQIKTKKKLRVTATAYSSHVGQTDSTPFLAAWNNRLRPGMKIIAVSRDMLTRYGMRNGTKVRIGGLPGYYRVRDKMNKRYKKRIDIYMGVDRRKALRWGRRSVVIYW
ncbi:LysM peptidoglycan-binding domain-containing protein [Sulfurovum sp.]|uniref:LysM peptidoglycan-binding domain-containing protein n=1 Tax=Sulfurovum sp. TaxID=1969726 RepID=UPI002867F790|nr:LysM peptidoglycan-binding domain-containing protein [Sulfurovum sp.]